jgi:hypothetical protein
VELLNLTIGSFSSGVVAATSSYESIQTVTATGGETSLSFNSIPGTYSSLQIRGITRRADASTVIATDTLRFNSDTGANYSTHRLSGDGSTATAGGNGGATEIVFSRGTGATATAGMFGAVVADIIDYASTTKNKTVRSFTGFDINASGGNVYLLSGAWFNTSAITTITIFANGNTIAAGTTYSLYGIKG